MTPEVDEKELTRRDLLAWCRRKHEEGHELKFVWNGGGDSGWCSLQINEGENFSEQDAPYVEALEDLMDNELDYGSWAGEFYANGEAYFNPEDNSFSGTDTCSSDDSESLCLNKTVLIPAWLPFDEIDIRFEVSEDGADIYPDDVEVDFRMQNGFLTPQHEQIARRISNTLPNLVNDRVTARIDNCGDEYRGVYLNESYKLEDLTLTESGKNRRLDIGYFSMLTIEKEERDIYLDLSGEEDEE